MQVDIMFVPGSELKICDDSILIEYICFVKGWVCLVGWFVKLCVALFVYFWLSRNNL